MAAELDVSISSQQATAGANELIRVCNQIIDAVKKVDSTLTAGQQQIDKFGDSFSSESKEIKTAVAEMSSALKKSESDLESRGKAQEESTSRAARYISKLQDLIKIEQYAARVNKESGVSSEESARKKAVFVAQVQKNIAAMSAEGQQVNLLVRQLMGLKSANETLATSQASLNKREDFRASLVQEEDILARVNARATELGVKVSELTAYKQFLARATRLNIDLNSEEFASLQKLYIAKEDQIRIGKNIAAPPAVAPTASRAAGLSIASTPAALDLEVAKTQQLVSIYSQYSGNTAELAIQKEILNRKIAAGNSLSDVEIGRIEKRVRAIYQNKEAVSQLVLEEERRQKAAGVVGGLSSEGAQLDKTIGIYQQYGANIREVAIQKEILNRVSMAGGTVTAQERKSIEDSVRASASKREELSRLEKKYGDTTAAASRFSGGLTRMQLILSSLVYMGLHRAVSSVADFYTNLSIANAVTEASVSEMGQLEAAARKLGETTVFTAGEAANGIQFLGQAGMNVENILKTLPDTLNLASAGSIDLGRAADIATNMMASFGLQAGQMGQAADIIAYTAAKSNTNVEQLAEGMKYAGPAAKAAGLSLGETAAIIGTLSNSGIQASMSGTSLRQALIQLSKEPTKNATKALKELGLTFDDISLKNNTFEQAIGKLASRGMNLGQAAAIFDTRAATAMLALADLIPVWGRLNEGIDGAAGTAERMARIRLDNLTGDFRLLASAVEELILTMGDAGMLTLLRSLTTNAKDVVLVTQDMIAAWNALWEESDNNVASLTEFSQKAHDVGLAIGLVGTGLGKFSVGLEGVKTDAERVAEPIVRLSDVALNLGKTLVGITAIKFGVWAFESATGVVLLSKALSGAATAAELATAASLAFKGAVAWLSGPLGVVLVASASYTVLKEWYDITSETEKANNQIATMNRQLADMAMYSKRAATELIKITAEQYSDLFEGLSIKPAAKITVEDPRPKQLLDDWRKINDLIEEYRSYGSFLPPAQARELALLEIAQQSMGKMMGDLSLASARLNSNLKVTEKRLFDIQAAVRMVSAVATGMPEAIFQIGKPNMPSDDVGGSGEDRGKSYENFIKNLERAAKEQKELNRLRKEYGDNEDLINLKLKIYNTLLEAKDIKGGISSAEAKRVERIITETAKQENLNKSVKAFLDLKKETRDLSSMAKYASDYGTDSMQYSVAKQMKDFLKANPNLTPSEIMEGKESFIKQFFDNRTIRDTKKGEKKEKTDTEKGAEAYEKYLATVERDIEITSEKIRLTEQYGKNQDLLNVKIKDYEQHLSLQNELTERSVNLDSDQRKNLEEQLRLRDEIKEKYDAEAERVKKIVEVNKELTNSFVNAVKEAKTFRDAFIRLGDAAQELVMKMAANRVAEGLFGLAMSGIGRTKGSGKGIFSALEPNASGGLFAAGNKVQAFASGGVFVGPTVFPIPGGKVGLAGERSDEVFMPAKRMSNGDVGVRIQVPVGSKSSGGVAISNQFNIKVDGGSREQNDDAANKVSKNVELAVRNVVYDVMMRKGIRRRTATII